MEALEVLRRDFDEVEQNLDATKTAIGNLLREKNKAQKALDKKTLEYNDITQKYSPDQPQHFQSTTSYNI